MKRMKRIVITVTVPDDMEDATAANLATEIGTDPVAWEWENFWTDVREGVVGPAGDEEAR